MNDPMPAHNSEPEFEAGRRDHEVAHITETPPTPPENMCAASNLDEASSVLDQKVAVFDSVTSSRPSAHPTLREALIMIQRGDHDSVVSEIRSLKSVEAGLPEDSPARKQLAVKRAQLKQMLPAFTISCDCATREAGAPLDQRGIRLTGIMQIDLDGIPPEKVARVRGQLEGHPSVVFVFESPSGGLKAGLHVDGAGDPARHKQAFKVAAGIVRKLTGYEIDRQTSDVQRLCYFSSDPDLYLNPDPEMLRSEIEGMGERVATAGLIEFDRHHTLLWAAIESRHANKQAAGIRKELDELAARCTREIPPAEIEGILTWVVNNITPESEFDVTDPGAWPEPRRLPEGLPPVLPMTRDMLPDVLWRSSTDIAERLQCPVEFPVVAMAVAAGAVIGRQIGIRPNALDDWTEVANLWGFGVGSPGLLKSPSTREALQPVSRLERKALQKYERDLESYEDCVARAQPRIKALKAEVDRLMAEGEAEAAEQKMDELLEAEPDKPVRKRYIVNDPTVEKLLELLADSPNGQLWIRDELSGLLRNMERKGREGDRTFLLECWNGSGSYSTDRIGRGNTHVENTIVSIFGTIQPEPLAQYMAGQAKEGPGNDGFMQRFQLAVWPDANKEWEDVDRVPDELARESARELFNRLANLTQYYGGAEQSDDVPFLRFDEDAQALFKVYRRKLELHLRSGLEGPAMEAHLAKFRGLIPRLALVFHLCQSDGGPVSRDALEKALRFAKCLESHARRIYTFAEVGDLFAARRLADRILDGSVSGAFTARDIYRRNWSGLSKQDVELALDVLVEARWVAVKREITAGRPRDLYLVNPRLEVADSAEGGDDGQDSIWPV